VIAVAARARARIGSLDGALVVGAAAVTVTLWASAFVGIRSAGRELSPGALALGRLLVGSAGLGLVMLLRREGLPPRRAVLGGVLSGALWFGGYMLALNEAERRIDAGTAAMVVNVGPILIALLAGVILKEGFPRALLAGCIVAFAGAALIGYATSRHGVGLDGGVLLAALAACLYAGGVVAQKPALRYASPLQVTWLGCTVGMLVCVPFLPSLVHQVGDASGSALGWTVYLGVMPTSVAFVTWTFALTRVPAGRLGATTYLAPPIAILLAWLILGETPPALALPGGALCLAGVALTRRRATSRSRSSGRQ
jgi:drug/metabolite transporter (DMT)-like permease